MFTFNLGIFSILFLTGLILGRLLFLMQHTKQVILFSSIALRKSIFNTAMGALFITFSFYFASISLFSHYYNQAEDAYKAGNISRADKLNAIASSIYPFDDRPHLLYVRLYQYLASNIEGLDEQTKQVFYQRALDYLQQARRINPHIGQTDYLHAKLIELNPQFSNKDWKIDVIQLYLQALKKNPLHLQASRRLARFYVLQGELDQASNTIYNALLYRRRSNENTLKFYNFAEQIFLAAGNLQHLSLLSTKKAKYIEIQQRKSSKRRSAN